MKFFYTITEKKVFFFNLRKATGSVYTIKGRRASAITVDFEKRRLVGPRTAGRDRRGPGKGAGCHSLAGVAE